MNTVITPKIIKNKSRFFNINRENLNHIDHRATTLAPQISLINPKRESYARIDYALKKLTDVQ